MQHRILPEMSEKDFALFSNLLKKELGISMRKRNKKMFGMKISRRLQDLGISSFSGYYRYLLEPEGSKEMRHLIDIATITQTCFFREREQFEVLRKNILPDLILQKTEKKRLRIWSAACSTGQEAYSLAMLVYEMNDVDLSWDIKILASDANVCSLKIAYSGEYNAEQVDRVPPDYLVKYFSRKKINGKEIFQIKNTLKEKLIFRRLNLMVSIKRLAGPIDLIFCRNVLIYFDFTAKKEIINQFYDLLEPKGYLCLGTSESLLGIDDRFYQKGRAIYQKK